MEGSDIFEESRVLIGDEKTNGLEKQSIWKHLKQHKNSKRIAIFLS
jgi:hypothetical protein